MNMNYLALTSLKHYSIVSANEQDRQLALRLYTQLRSNLIHTVVEEYQRTGYFWEHYNDTTGKGMRGHPFTGWTALIVNIIAESYY